MNASDAASILNVSAPSLRAYSQLLEQNGYKIHKNANKQRQYNEHDIDIISAMLALKNRGELSLKEAAIKVSSADFSPSSVVQSIAERKRDEQSAMTVETFDNELYRILELMSDEMVAMRAENKALNERLIGLESKQDATLKAIESDNEGNEQMNELMNEIKKLNAKIESLEEEQSQQKKPSLLARLFRK